MFNKDLIKIEQLINTIELEQLKKKLDANA